MRQRYQDVTKIFPGTQMAGISVQRYFSGGFFELLKAEYTDMRMSTAGAHSQRDPHAVLHFTAKNPNGISE